MAEYGPRKGALVVPREDLVVVVVALVDGANYHGDVCICIISNKRNFIFLLVSCLMHIL